MHFVVVNFVKAHNIGSVHGNILVTGRDEKIVEYTGKYAFFFTCAQL